MIFWPGSKNSKQGEEMQGGETTMEISEWERDLEIERGRKNAFFAEHWQSPIAPEDRKRFKGLDYFPPDPNYRFELELHEHEEKKLVKMAYTKGQERDFTRWGEFRFIVGGKECKLQAYKSNPEDEVIHSFQRCNLRQGNIWCGTVS